VGVGISQEFGLIELNEIAAKGHLITWAQLAVDGIQQLARSVIRAVIDERVAQSIAGIPIGIRRHRMLRINVVLVNNCRPIDVICVVG
jgi:hypothetical protein